MKFRLTTAAVAAAFPLSAPLALAQDAVGETVVVTATRQHQRADEVLASVEVIDRKAIEQAGHSTLVELLSAQPGVQVVSTGGPGSNASIFIRGANSSHTLMLIDGMRVGSATSGQPSIEMIPLALIDRIEILRGPASALYGSDAIGGVIQIFTRRGESVFAPSVRAGFGSFDTRTLDASVSAGTGRLRYSLAAGYDETSGFDARPDSRVGSDADDDGFRGRFASASASLGLREHDEIGVNLFHSEGRNWYDTGQVFDSFLDKHVTSGGVRMANRLTGKWTSTLKLGYSEDGLKSRATADMPSRFDTHQTEFAWQNDVRVAGGSLLAAYEHLEQRVATTGRLDRRRRDVHSVLLGWTGSVAAHSFQANVRHDDSSQFGDKTTGLLAYGYQFDPAWRVQASLGTGFKAPTFNDLFFPLSCFPPFGCFGGNPDLKPEKAFNRELGLVWESGVTTVRATYFRNTIENLIVWTNTPSNLGRVEIEGVELGVTTTLKGYRLRAGIDFLDARDEDTDERVVRRAGKSAYAGVDRNLGAWNFGLDWRGQGRRYDNDTASFPARRVTLGGYGVLSAFAHYAFAPDWRLELRANNILDKKYELADGFARPRANAFVAVRYAPR
ncbi:MAG TPA: TonB-dependent receptor [Rhodocyclaceae bacterium]|nr:TonB-dependent receptor [Rhodocyclaceae bacterium]